MHDHAAMGDGLLVGSLFVTGLAASLHCVGMCGPILLAFGGVLNDDGKPRFLDLMLFHIGRLWTYALLGAFAGFSGIALRSFLDQARGPILVTGLMIVLGGVAALGILPGLRLQASLPGCIATNFRRSAQLLRSGGIFGRLILGAAQGFVPCGMVYAMLLAAATLPNPLASAGAMLAFGLGTTPLLTAAILGLRTLPTKIRLAGPRLVAGSWIVVGMVVLVRGISS